MATAPLAPHGVVIGADRFPPAAAAHIAGKLLNYHSPGEIAQAIEVLLDLLDLMGGDPEAEPITWPEDVRAVDRERLPDDSEAAGDEADAAWIEWQSLPSATRRAGGHGGVHSEDDEEDDEDCAIDDGACDDADQGDIENDVARTLPAPLYGADQRSVLMQDRFGTRTFFQHES